jgi:hypothetical protein
MNRIRILVCRVDDAEPGHMIEFVAFDFPSVTSLLGNVRQHSISWRLPQGSR